VNVTKATLEGLFADELALLQPTPGYMRLLKESVLQIWKARKAAVRAFAERILPHTADLWVQASLDQRHRFQQLFFPDGIAFDGNRFVGTGATAPAFSYLRGIESEKEGLVAQIFTSWNPLTGWLRKVGEYQRAA
jgi:hypothetical protein